MANTAVEVPVRRFERIPRTPALVAAGLIVLGAIGWALALATDADRAWRAYLQNWLYWTSIANGAVMFAAALSMVNGIWARSIRRVAVSTVAFLPIAYLLLIPLFFVGGRIFPWVEQGAGPQASYLNVPFLVARQLVLLGVCFLVSLVFVYWALRPDAGLVVDAGGPSAGSGLYRFLTRGWLGQEAEEARASRRLSRLGPILGLCYGVAFSVVAFDFVMAMEKEWWSTLIGPYFFMGAFLGGLATTVVLTVIYRRALGLERLVEATTLHDVGKLTFGFCVFWGYLFWAQYIVIWYGQLPHEQAFVVHRLGGVFRPVSILVFWMLFILPFFGLLGVLPKRTPGWLAGAAAVILTGLWFERYTLLYPSYYHAAHVLPLGWQEVVTTLPFAGLFVLAVLWFASTFPMVQMWEPLWEPELAERPDEFQTAAGHALGTE